MAVMPLHLTTLSSMFSVINYYLWIITIKSRLKLKNSRGQEAGELHLTAETCDYVECRII